MSDPNNIPGYSQCYVRWNRRFTQNNSGSIAVYQAGMLVTVPNSDVARFVAAGVLHQPGAPYVAGPVDINE